MGYPRAVLSILACLGMAACSPSSSDRLLGTWRMEQDMPMTLYASPPSSSGSDDAVAGSGHAGAGVPVHMPWQVTINPDMFRIAMGPPDEGSAKARGNAAAIIHVDQAYSLVSVHGDDIVVAFDQKGSLKPVLNTIHFVSHDRFWMTNAAPAKADGPRMWFHRVQ